MYNIFTGDRAGRPDDLFEVKMYMYVVDLVEKLITLLMMYKFIKHIFQMIMIYVVKIFATYSKTIRGCSRGTDGYTTSTV